MNIVGFRKSAMRLGWVYGLILFAAGWFLVSELGLIREDILPAPQDVLTRMALDLSQGETWQNIGVTTRAWLLATPLGYLSGFVIAILLIASPLVFRAVQPYLLMANSIPLVVLAPIFILSLGIGLSSRVAIGISIIVFPAIFGIYGGMRLCDPRLIASVEMFGASRRQVWTLVRIPAALPYLVTNWRLAVSLGLLGAVVGEILISPSGLGWLIRVRGSLFDLSGIFSVLFIILILALGSNALTDLAATRILKWHQQ